MFTEIFSIFTMENIYKSYMPFIKLYILISCIIDIYKYSIAYTYCKKVISFTFMLYLHKNKGEYSTLYRRISKNKPDIIIKNKLNIKRYSSSSREIKSYNPGQSLEVTTFIQDNNIKPIFIYENLHMEGIKARVLSETRDLAGIYLILNKTTGDYYVGSASTGKFNSRFVNHLFNFNGSKVVKNAVKKYKISAFAFIILEIFPEVVTKKNNKSLLDLEDFYLKSLLPNYNILTEAGSSFGYKHTEISRIKMRSNYSEERRMTLANLNKGKTFSLETIEAMKKAALNRLKPLYSLKAVNNMKKNSKAIIVYNFDYTVFAEFPSILEASKSLGCDQKTIRRALKNPKNILRRR
jgi:group I intron endonuclease